MNNHDDIDQLVLAGEHAASILDEPISDVCKDTPDVHGLIEKINAMLGTRVKKINIPNDVVFNILKFCFYVCESSVFDESPHCSIWTGVPNSYCSYECLYAHDEHRQGGQTQMLLTTPSTCMRIKHARWK